MDSTFVQAFLWVAAGSLMLLYFKRRRNRKSMQ